MKRQEAIEILLSNSKKLYQYSRAVDKPIKCSIEGFAIYVDGCDNVTFIYGARRGDDGPCFYRNGRWNIRIGIELNSNIKVI